MFPRKFGFNKSAKVVCIVCAGGERVEEEIAAELESRKNRKQQN